MNIHLPHLDWAATTFALGLIVAFLASLWCTSLLYRKTGFFPWLAQALSGDDGRPSASRLGMFLGSVTMSAGLLYVEIAYGIRVQFYGADPMSLATPLITALTTGGTAAYVMRNASKYAPGRTPSPPAPADDSGTPP